MALDLDISGLKVAGASDRILLRIDALAIPAGTCLGVRGPSGAGKSTFLFACAGLAAQARGRIRWGDDDMLALGPEARARFRRHHIGMVFQDFLLFEELSALENAALPGAYASRARQAEIAENAQAALSRLGITHGDRTVESFSGGERQRVAIARALAGSPQVLLADEPTASLDRKTADALIADLVMLMREQGRTLIAVSHDPAVHARMDRVIEIVDGQIIIDESPDA